MSDPNPIEAGGEPNLPRQIFRNPFRRLYEWVLSWAHSPFGTAALALVSFAESSFFPIPPDVLQMALSIERPKRSFFYAGVNALASVAGALLGWVIGFALWGWLEPVFVPHIISAENIERVRATFDQWGFWALFAAAFTPIPFKVFTITGGMMQMNLPVFLAASLIGRSLRFFLLGALVAYFGPTVKRWIDRWFGWVTLGLIVLVIAGFYSIKYLI